MVFVCLAKEYEFHQKNKYVIIHLFIRNGMFLFLFPHYILAYIVLYFSEMGTIFTPKWVPIYPKI